MENANIERDQINVSDKIISTRRSDNKNKSVTRLEVLRLLFLADRERGQLARVSRYLGKNNIKQSFGANKKGTDNLKS